MTSETNSNLLIFEFGEFELECGNAIELFDKNRQSIQLAPKELMLLKRFLMRVLDQRTDNVLHKDELTGAEDPLSTDEAKRWNYRNESGLTTAIGVLRDSLGDTKEDPKFIRTRSGFGYEFVCCVRLIDRKETVEGPCQLSLQKPTTANYQSLFNWFFRTVIVALVFALVFFTLTREHDISFEASISIAFEERKRLNDEALLAYFYAVAEFEESVEQYYGQLDKIALSVIQGRLASTDSQREEAAQAFKDSLVIASDLDERRRVIRTAIERLEAIGSLGNLSTARNELVEGLVMTHQSMDDLEGSLRSGAKQLSGVDVPKNESFASLLVTAAAKKKAAINLIESADAKFALAIDNWPGAGGRTM